MDDPREPVKDDVTGRLIANFKRMIAEGAIMPGARLPPERELAETFGVSRSSLRQALKILGSMGVIYQRVGDGTYLNAGAPAVLEESMEFLILLERIGFQELLDARILVEPEMAARAAGRATRQSLAEIEHVQEQMEANRDDVERFISCDIAFHQCIYRMAGNRVLSTVFTVLHQSIHDLMVVTTPPANKDKPIAFHRRILEALRVGDSEEARRGMQAHLTDVSTLISPEPAWVGRQATYP